MANKNKNKLELKLKKNVEPNVEPNVFNIINKFIDTYNLNDLDKAYNLALEFNQELFEHKVDYLINNVKTTYNSEVIN